MMTTLLPNAAVLGCGILSALILLRAVANLLSQDFGDMFEE